MFSTEPDEAGAAGERGPDRIGRYRVVRRVGEGGMGVVYEGVDLELDRRVALKIVRGASASFAERLRREAKAMARLSDPNVATVHEITVIDDNVCVAMEYVQGATLRAWLGSASRAPGEIAAVFAQAGRGLLAAHRAGIVHRDFKPENVMVGADGRVRVLDFGLAMTGGEWVPGEDRVPTLTQANGDLGRLTLTGAMMGTPLYMAPEQFDAMECDARTDQFAFCVALYEAFFQTRPYPG